MKKIIVLLAIFMNIVACGKSVNTSNDQISQSPCEILTETEIKNALDIPEDAETSIKEKNTTYPACFYKWKAITFPYEIFNGQTADYPAEMSIVWYVGANKNKYEQSISIYKNPEAINGVGDMATYTEKMSQITFLSKGSIIHVHVKTSADATFNKSKAIKVAKLIVEKL